MLTSNQGLLLPMEAWYPYNIDNLANFLLSYVQQILGGTPVILFHISLDSFFVCLILNLCMKLHLLQYRLKNFPISYSTFEKKMKPLNQMDGTSDFMNINDYLSNFSKKHDDILQ